MEILEKVKALNLPAKQFVVMGSAILEMKGIRKIGDLDIMVTPEVFDRLKNDPEWEYKSEIGDVGGGVSVELLDNHKGSQLYKYIFAAGDGINFFLNNPEKREEIEGVYFSSLSNLLEIKSGSWDRPKDREDAVLIRKYLKENLKN
jgi:hypothetical protein